METTDTDEGTFCVCLYTRTACGTSNEYFAEERINGLARAKCHASQMLAEYARPNIVTGYDIVQVTTDEDGEETAEPIDTAEIWGEMAEQEPPKTATASHSIFACREMRDLCDTLTRETGATFAATSNTTARAETPRRHMLTPSACAELSTYCRGRGKHWRAYIDNDHHTTHILLTEPVKGEQVGVIHVTETISTTLDYIVTDWQNLAATYGTAAAGIAEDTAIQQAFKCDFRNTDGIALQRVRTQTDTRTMYATPESPDLM